jgi:hypothetical protein
VERQQRYLSYLVRLWQTSDGGKQIWRASLESPATGERKGFGSLQELFEFLEEQTQGQMDLPGPSGRRSNEPDNSA